MTSRRIGLPVLAIYGLLSFSAQAETIQVTIDKLVFTPAEVNAKVGDTIEWVNKDTLLHNAKATNGDWTVSLPPKQNGQVVLKKAGTVDYFCTLHPNMKGRIIVAPAS